MPSGLEGVPCADRALDRDVNLDKMILAWFDSVGLDVFIQGGPVGESKGKAVVDGSIRGRGEVDDLDILSFSLSSKERVDVEAGGLYPKSLYISLSQVASNH